MISIRVIFCSMEILKCALCEGGSQWSRILESFMTYLITESFLPIAAIRIIYSVF